MAYEMCLSRTHPGCLVLLLDQSSGMSGFFGGDQLTSGKSKSEMIAHVVDSFLEECVKCTTVGTSVRPLLDIAVVGYAGNRVKSLLSGKLALKPFVNLDELRSNPMRVGTRSKQEMDESGNIIAVSYNFPVWIEPFASGNAPMCTALKHAGNLVGQWVTRHPKNFPPIVVNVTSGRASDGDPTYQALELRNLGTEDGETLLFNCQLADESVSLGFPSDEHDVPPHIPLARLLYRLATPIPGVLLEKISLVAGQAPPLGARLYVLNGDFASARLLFTFVD